MEWFILLRLFPALVTAPLRRGSRNGGRILLHRLELWRSHQWVALYEEVQAQEAERAVRRAQHKPQHGGTKRDVDLDTPVVDDTCLHRSSQLAIDGDISLAASALDNRPLAPSDEFTFRGLQSRHPQAEHDARHLAPGKTGHASSWSWRH